jgi:hypothetical protein
MVNNFKGNKGQIYVLRPSTTTCSLQIKHIKHLHQIGQLPKQQLHNNVKIELI